MIDPRYEDEAISILMEEALSETTEETKFDVEAYIANSDFDWQKVGRLSTFSFPGVVNPHNPQIHFLTH